MSVDNDLKMYRAREDLTQAELASAVGVSRQTIHTIEAGKYNPSLELALELAAFFDEPLETMFYLDDADG